MSEHLIPSKTSYAPLLQLEEAAGGYIESGRICIPDYALERVINPDRFRRDILDVLTEITAQFAEKLDLPLNEVLLVQDSPPDRSEYRLWLRTKNPVKKRLKIDVCGTDEIQVIDI
jgi:hypothetical protein